LIGISTFFNIDWFDGTPGPRGRCELIPERGGIGHRPQSAAQMIKSLTALAILAMLGASVIALPGFAPQVEASETAALAKGDRLELRSAARKCSQQVWPDFDTSCLRKGDVMIREARLVTARH
jgi:hypothetical protein